MEFPTADDVPFPYESPYGVQRDLMSAILGALRQIRANDIDEQTLHHDLRSVPPAGGVQYEYRAPIIMAESPTGTGKSLSLACASMAWLKHYESRDLLDQMIRPTSSEDQQAAAAMASANAVSPTASQVNIPSKPKTYDWIEAWQPPEDTPPPDNHVQDAHRSNTFLSKTENARSFAMENRNALHDELGKIRSRLDRLLNIASAAASSEIEGNNASATERTIRGNLVRSGVASVMANKKKLNRNVARARKNTSSHKRAKCTSPEDDFLLDAYHSDKEVRGDNCSDDSDDEEDAAKLKDLSRSDVKNKNSVQPAHLSAKAMMEGSNLDGSGYPRDPEINTRRSWGGNGTTDKTSVGDVTPGSGVRKVIYAARTHSQNSQFIGELKRTHWGKDVKVVALGSRSLLCNNEAVLYSSRTNKKSSRRSESEITEMCLDMQKSKTGSGKRTSDGKAKGKNTSSKCPHLTSSESISTLALHSLVRPTDIEDMASLGKASNCCSYYASREALAAAEVVVVPYNTLLSPQARESVGLSIKGALIVVDEAHNTPETLRALSSCSLSLAVLTAALDQLLAYNKKYSGRLAGRNVFYLGQIRRILTTMIRFLKRRPKSRDGVEPQRKQMLDAVDLIFKLKLDNINLFSILRYLEKSRLSQKLLGFMNYQTSREEVVSDNNSKDQKLSKHVSSMSFVETFLDRLTGTSREGKVIAEWPEEENSCSSTASFRFVQISSASQLDSIAKEAHAIVLAGGTLRPFSHVAAELFANDAEVMVAASKAEAELSDTYDHASNGPPSSVQVTPSLTTFTCGHVIPPSNVLTSCLSIGPSSRKLDFRHGTRSTTEMIDELGLSILILCDAVPNGFVVFLPSYRYESQVFQRWRSTGMLQQIGKKKCIHREPKNSREVDDLLCRYSAKASATKEGALLFSVMGGKMSEGINFADHLCRCVLVAGLPFPDITDPILKEKMSSLDKGKRDAGMGITGQEYYQNLCMRTVNQSVGRAIRHAKDYAAIVLCDFRYASDRRIWRGLPQWLRKGSGAPRQAECAFASVHKSIEIFFAGK